MTDANATSPKNAKPDGHDNEPVADDVFAEDEGAPRAGAPDADAPEALRERIASLEDALLRARAEVQNIQRRAANERAEAVRFGNAELLKAIVPVLDDLDRAIQHATDQADVRALLDGVRLVRENLLKALGSFGLEPIDAAGQPFDPHQHEALMQQPTDAQPPGTVLEEVARGYRLRDRTLRPAKVIVAAASQGENDGER
ncbi:MAG: nucleotide exchange factor GrpE [Phycisphaerae bacterium]|nr:nucleotide exchange factor GrpE [Phycisphaerae bacterium]